MTRSSRLAAGLAAAVILSASVASAQTYPDHPWTHGSTLQLFGGAAMASSSDTRPTLGAGFGWEINRRISVEGSGSWLVAPHGDEAFAAEMTALANLTRPRTVVPYVGAGMGVYVASFDAGSTAIPPFYQQRITSSAVATSQTFTDPSFVFAAGANIFTGTHVSIRPDVTLRLVRGGSDTYPVTMVAVHFSYHFETHGAKP
jgi:Outer membrane protein beta-barrel domain